MLPTAIWLTVLGTAAAYGALLAALFVAMRLPPLRFGRLMRHYPDWGMSLVPFERMWNVARRGDLHVGDPAPDFSLKTVDRQTEVRLSSAHRDRPVVLVFGSYT